MAREVGADVFDGTLHISQKAAPNGGLTPPFDIMTIQLTTTQPNMLVNRLGEWFVDEEWFYVDCHGINAIKLQLEGIGFFHLLCQSSDKLQQM